MLSVVILNVVRLIVIAIPIVVTVKYGFPVMLVYTVAKSALS
jgi:hypothetical protein